MSAEGYVLAVDLGTSCSSAAVRDGDEATLLDVGGDSRIPSTVVLTDRGDLIAGVDADRSILRAPGRAERNPKLYVGHDAMLLGDERVPPERALAATLRLFVAEAAVVSGQDRPSRFVLTHPVAWSDAQLDVLAKAAAAVLPDVDAVLVSEPEASAMHYAHSEALSPGSRVAVYDLGGGTFDAVVLRATADGFERVGRGTGDLEIGGEAFDRAVVTLLVRQLEHRAPEWCRELAGDLRKAAELLSAARRIREALSRHSTASDQIASAGVDVELTVSELEECIRPAVERTVALLTEIVEASGGTGPDLRGVFLTGGASLTPLVGVLLRQAFPGLVRTGRDPKSVVALGASRSGPVRRRAAPPIALGCRDGVVDLGEAHDARTAGGAVYLLATGAGQTPEVRRVDARDGRVIADRPTRTVISWDACEHGLVLVERNRGSTFLRSRDPDLAVRTTRSVSAGHDPHVVIDGSTGWVVYRTPPTPRIDGARGLRGETGNLVAESFRLDARRARENRVVKLGAADAWYLAEDDDDRRLLDPAMPTSTPPAPLGARGGLAVVQGRHRSGLRQRLGGEVASASQLVRAVRADGAVRVLGALERHTESDWIHQIVEHDGRWFLATGSGLRVLDSHAGRVPQLVHPRPSGGAVRWVSAGCHMFALVVESVRRHAGVTVHVLEERDELRELGRWTGLLGNVVSVRASERPRIQVHENSVILGCAAGRDRSVILRVTRERGAEIVHEAPGWCAPVGAVPGAVIALHEPTHPPGDASPPSGRVVRVPIDVST